MIIVLSYKRSYSNTHFSCFYLSLSFLTMTTIHFKTEIIESSIINSKGKIYACVEPQIGLVLCYNTFLGSYGYNIASGYVVLRIYYRAGTDLVNKADVGYVLSSDTEMNTVTYDENTTETIFLTQAGNWKMKHRKDPQPYIDFGSLCLPMTQEQRDAHAEYRLGC